MSNLTKLTLTTTFLLLLASPTLTTTNTLNICLNQRLKSLIEAGCNFDPEPELYNLFKSQGSISLDLNQGMGTVEESQYIYPEAQFYQNYFEQAVAHPKQAISGDVGTGMKFQGGFITVQSSFINLCSDDGKIVSHSRYRGYFVMKDLGINATKEAIRMAAWQLICEEKVTVYKKLVQ